MLVYNKGSEKGINFCSSVNIFGSIILLSIKNFKFDNKIECGNQFNKTGRSL